MKCVMIANNRESQECIEEKCYFWDRGKGMCKWMTKK
jgi:hypothetical protein